MTEYPLGPKSVTYAGNAYNIFSRVFLDWALSDEKAAEIINWSKHIYSPDEFVWANLIRMPQAPGTYQGKPDHWTRARAIIWVRFFF